MQGKAEEDPSPTGEKGHEHQSKKEQTSCPGCQKRATEEQDSSGQKEAQSSYRANPPSILDRSIRAIRYGYSGMHCEYGFVEDTLRGLLTIEGIDRMRSI